MKQVKKSFVYFRYESEEDLTSEELNLYNRAKDAALNAYAVYSNFKVGCAILLDDNSIVIGNNQENIAYPSGLCAERVALFTYGASFANKQIRALAVYATNEGQDLGEMLSPCGACRQVMVEYEQRNGKPYSVIMPGPNNSVLKIEEASQLLPLHFASKAVKKHS